MERYLHVVIEIHICAAARIKDLTRARHRLCARLLVVPLVCDLMGGRK